MFKANQAPLQRPLIGGTVDYLDEKKQKILEESWAETFRQEILLRIDESAFEGMYSDKKSRPNTPINMLLGWEIIKTGAGLDDRSMHERCQFDIQVRHALGLDYLNEGDFSLRTVYNFRSRVREYELETEKDLIKECFKQVTDAQMKSWQIKSEEARVDSVQVRSNMAKMGRLQLVIESVRRVERMLDEEDRGKYIEMLTPWTGKRGLNYVYGVAAGEYQSELEKVGEVVQRLVVELGEKYGEQKPYQAMCQIFNEQYKVVSEKASENQVEIQAVAPTETDAGLDKEANVEQSAPVSEQVEGTGASVDETVAGDVVIDESNLEQTPPDSSTVVANEESANETVAYSTVANEVVADTVHTDEVVANSTNTAQACVDTMPPVTADTGETVMVEEVTMAQSFVVREASEIPSGSIQSPDDLEATYRTKAGENYQGYVTNIVETSSPDNDFQLIIDVSTDSNNVDDAQLLLDALPDLQQCTDMKQVRTDGGYIGSELDQALEDAGIEQLVTAIRGRQPDPNRITLAQFEIHDSDGTPHQITCPEGQEIPVEQGKTDSTFIARPDSERCQQCPLLALCAARPSKNGATPTIYFNLQNLRNARRRQAMARQPDGSNPRAAVEATVRSVTHPLPHHKVPLRGKHNVSRYMIYSAMMVNARRIFSKVLRDLAHLSLYFTFFPLFPRLLPSWVTFSSFFSFQHQILLRSPAFNPIPSSLA